MCHEETNKKIAKRGVSWLDSSAVVAEVAAASALYVFETSFRAIFEEGAIVRPVVPSFCFPLHRTTATLVTLMQTFAGALFIE